MSQQIIPKRLSISSSYSSFIDSPRIIATPLRFKNPLRNQNKKVSITIPKLDNSNDQNDINFQSERIRKNFNNKFMKSPTLSPSKFIKIPSSASDNQKIISSIKGTSSYKTVKFKAELNEIEEDGDHDYLLGNMGKSLIRNKKHLRSKTEKYAENNNVNPYVSNTPKDFVKSQFNYDPNFKKTFESFINGKTDMKSLMNIKNFPSLFKFNENEQNKLTNISLLPKPKIGSLTERKFIKKNEEKKEESLSNTSKDKKINESLKDVSSTKNTALRHFDQIKEIVQKRLMLKKKIKNEAFEVNDWNVKFFQNFYSITKEYIEKIKKKDIITVNVKKNYYDKDYPTSQRLMKNFTFMNYTKSPSLFKLLN